ncbi:prolyl-tRNA synthetase associated domain-containing protein [Companilactobacillus halodurans]|uniref:Prolyl-tRNA synthetase associated domain-containing protein n=1 Tax=Companilactobacillus halodurans TaxID=2584183 RepID=A0A5P0ZWS3_9LACO|nr:prolyl-tRNA synthetase associated domain-containing protein [Companilactobacillus halodurans]MQS75473.1 prolyl-tRNA synthetase associated domain-containing protein [Companilactobacillus halodurans]MQS97479.1 prolyl-tRNA synthetase associated domain-containing protein [Companilactobacillus halodurans]
MTKGTKKAYIDLLDNLDKLEISYKIVDHPAAETIQQADSYIAGLEGVRTKSMFLKDKKHFYMIVMDDKKRLDFKDFQQLTGTKRLSMAHNHDIDEQLGLEAGIISPFGLINNQTHNIQVFFDKEMLDAENILTFHPNLNTHTIFLEASDLMKFIKACGFDYKIIDLK